jgi:hypothetical protein
MLPHLAAGCAAQQVISVTLGYHARCRRLLKVYRQLGPETAQLAASPNLVGPFRVAQAAGVSSLIKDIEVVLREIEYWHQGSLTGFKIMYRDENGVWDGIRWDGRHPSFFGTHRVRITMTIDSFDEFM